ncbi:MAG: CBS domain-containing protein [Pirellulales bacterium]|nr:CBS domain-containing protein [Pirellulales bacterium]
MLLCPACGSENLDGADQCDECLHSLTDLSLPQAMTAVERGLLKDRIESLKPRSPIMVGPETPVGEVLKRMIDQRVGCVVIVDQQRRLLGIFTERDALMRLNVDAAKLADKPVSSLMTVSPATLRMRDKIAFALHRMHVGGYRHVPILDEQDRLAGVISIRGILSYLTERHLAKA